VAELKAAADSAGIGLFGQTEVDADSN